MPPNDRYLTLDDLRKRIETGEIDTVILAFTDMQGRLQGKRLHGQYFLDVVVEHGTEGCNYLLAVDVDMNTVDGYAISSWERGYGDMEFVPDWDTIRLLPHLPATAMVQCDLVWLDHAPVVQSPRSILKAQLDAFAEPRPGRAGGHRAGVHRVQHVVRGRAPDGPPRPRAGQPVQRRLLDPRYDARRAPAARHPEHHVRRRARRRGRQG